MDFLPIEVENIINHYKNQIEHIEKFKKTLKQIESIKYEVKESDINLFYSNRILNNRKIEYYSSNVYDFRSFYELDELYIYKYYGENDNIDKIIHETTIKYNSFVGTKIIKNDMDRGLLNNYPNTINSEDWDNFRDMIDLEDELEDESMDSSFEQW
jgi:hypothetical protein